MQKLLLITAISPFPQNSGGATRIYQTIKYLSQKYDLYVLIFGEKIVDKLERDFLNRHCFFWQTYSLRERSIFSSQPYFFSCWQNHELIKEMQVLTANHDFAKVRIEFTQIAHIYKSLHSTVNTVFVAHDVSAISFYRRIMEEPNLFKRLFRFYIFIQIYFYEKKWLPKYDQVIAVSKIDQKLLIQKFNLQNVVCESNGISSISFLPPRKDDAINLGYIGSFSHPPNKTAVSHILNHILPKCKKHNLDVRLILAGENNLPKKIPLITNLGKISNVNVFYQQIDVLVAPIFSGSGTRIKILEALSKGRPVVTTKIGAEGISINSPYLQIISSEEEWVPAIIRAKRGFTKNETANLKSQLNKYLWSESFRKA